MSGGKNAEHESSSSMSTDLIQLLLRCVCNEVDTLRTQVMAALDELLLACIRQVEKWKVTISLQQQNTITPPDVNPWAVQTMLPTFANPSFSSTTPMDHWHGRCYRFYGQHVVIFHRNNHVLWLPAGQ